MNIGFFSHRPYAHVAQVMGMTIRAVRKKVCCQTTYHVSGVTKELVTANIIPEETSETSVWCLITNMGFHYKTSQRKCIHQVPLGEGECFVLVAAGTTNGFVEDSFLCYRAKNTSGDYHGKMSSEPFLRWLTTQLLPSLPEPLELVLDNAPNHSLLTEESRCPTTATRRADLISWLDYSELNAIEQMWGCMKRHVRSSLQQFTRTDLQATMEEAKLCATQEVPAGVVR
ncbi:hypothetical protein E2C01_047015 [Portunus trituberculatus]|uniref:Tc1-like transposase DDE domain-containing protein n=1 Tax=Portunus trituberculatus TaxID=210409 RepID=A0A5B7FZA4_PORTR|nr:hypothetical protein [Portunus trituberculatus]